LFWTTVYISYRIWCEKPTIGYKHSAYQERGFTRYEVCLCCCALHTLGVESYPTVSSVSPHVSTLDRIATPHCVECSVAIFELSLKPLCDVSLGGIKHKCTVTPHHVECSYRDDCTLHFISNTVWYPFVCY